MVKRCHLSVTRPGIASSSLIRRQWPTNVSFVTPRNPISPRKHGLCERLGIVRLSWFCGVSAGINASRNNSPVSFKRANSPVQVDTKRVLFANSTPQCFGDVGLPWLRSAVANAGTRWELGMRSIGRWKISLIAHAIPHPQVF